MSTSSARRAVTLGATAAALAVAAVVGQPAAAATPAAVAACAPGMVPWTNQNTWVRSDPGFTHVLYTIPEGRAFRIGAGPVVADGMVWWFGHGNQLSNGWVPEQNLSCG
jgi:hypothetical protein